MPSDARKVAVSITPLALEADSRALKIARSLARFGYRSIVVEGAGSRDADRFGLPVISLAKPAGGPPALATVRKRLRAGTGVTVADAAMAAAYRARYFWNFGVKPARLLPPADLYYLHGFTYAPAVARGRRASGAAYIYDAHDFYSDMADEAEVTEVERRWLNPFFEGIEQRCCAEAAAVVTVGDGVAALIAERFGCSPVVIRNAHDARTDRASEKDIRAATGLGADDRLIVVVGNDKPGQATENAIAALAGLPRHLHLAFLGEGYERHRALISRLGLSRSVHVLGRVPPDMVVPFITGADAAAILYYALSINYRRALPNKFFQAIAAGLPLLYSQELEEVAPICRRHAFGIGLDPRDPRSLADAFTRVLDRAAMQREQRAVQQAAKEMSWAAEEDRLGQLLRSLERNCAA